MQFRRCWCPFGGKGHGYEIIRDYFLLEDFNLYVIFTILAVVLNIQEILFLKQHRNISKIPKSGSSSSYTSPKVDKNR